MLTQRCGQCRREFTPKHPRAITCSAACRKERERDKSALKRSYNLMTREISRLSLIAKRRTINAWEFKRFSDEIRLHLVSLLRDAGDKETISMIAMLESRKREEV